MPTDLKMWRTDKPPNEVLVEARCYDDRVLRVKAFYGRDCSLPHWRSEDGNTHYSVSTFSRWRPIDVD